MTKRILTTPQVIDPGSQSGLGFDFQWHVTARTYINMLADKGIQYIVCEFHEDMIQVRHSLSLEVVQIKKRENTNWSLEDLIRPGKKQKQGVLGKLFNYIEQGKDVNKLILLGYGGVANSNDYSLSELILLICVPDEGRDQDWNSEFQRYKDFLAGRLVSQGISADTVNRAMEVLKIDFSLPHPSAIRDQNRDLLDNILKKIWNIELTTGELDLVYGAIYDQVKTLSLKPNQPWSAKAISRKSALSSVFEKISVFAPSANRQQQLTTQDKLTSAGLGQKAHYAFEKRLDAMQVRFELDMGSSEWETLRTEIDTNWRRLRTSNPQLKGPEMWESLRKTLAELGHNWAVGDGRMGPDFAEGVFFDMTGTCEVEWKLSI